MFEFPLALAGWELMFLTLFTLYKCITHLIVIHHSFYGFLPIIESDQYGPVELVLRAVGFRTTGVDERVNRRQNKTLLVKLLQLAWQLPHRGKAQRGRPT